MFFKSGFIVFAILWLLIATPLYYYHYPLNSQISLSILFSVICISVILGIYFQYVTVDNEFLTYSSNFFPLFNKRIVISQIGSIKFGRNFLPIVDPTGLSKLNMARTDQPLVGLIITNTSGNIIGGFNTKVFNQFDLKKITDRLIQINPNIKVV